MHVTVEKKRTDDAIQDSLVEGEGGRWAGAWIRFIPLGQM